jgi:phage terminase small subunit
LSRESKLATQTVAIEPAAADRMMALAAALKLTEKQRRFCEALVADPDRNQTAAALAAGYGAAGAHVKASETVRLGKVAAYLDALQAEAGALKRRRQEAEGAIAGAAEVLETMTAHMRADVDDFLDDFGSFDLQKARAAKKTRLLREVVVEEKLLKMGDGDEVLERRTKFKLVDPQKAADQLARHYRLYPDEAPPSAGSVTVVNVIGALPAPVRVQLAKALLGAGAKLAIEGEAKRVG